MAAAQFLKEDLHAKSIHMKKDHGVESPVIWGQGRISVRKLLDDLDRDQAGGRDNESGRLEAGHRLDSASGG